MSRLDKLKEQHPDLNVSIIDVLAKIDPTNSYKYVEFLIKRFKTYYEGENDILLSVGIELIGIDNVEKLNEFEKHCKEGRIKKNDISTYNSWKEMKEEIGRAEEIAKQKELEKQTKKIKKIYDNGEWLAVIPLSFEASKSYGYNTKWCTTQEQHWDRYIKNYKLIYIINRSTDVKYAISIKKGSDTEIQAWLSNDDEVSPMILDIPLELFMVCNTEIKKQETNLELMGGSKKQVKPSFTDRSKFGRYFTTYLDDVYELSDNWIQEMDLKKIREKWDLENY